MVREALEEKIRILNQFVWEDRVRGPTLADWLNQFSCDGDLEDDEQLQALFLLSHFLYFGQDELRCLVKSLYRDQIRAPMLRDIRYRNGDTTDWRVLRAKFGKELGASRFLPIGNPAESGAHILYYFRQENGLSRSLFRSAHEVFERQVTGRRVVLAIREQRVKNYVFIDDVRGSGSQVKSFCVDMVCALKSLGSRARVYYFALFGTTHGLDAVRSLGVFDRVEAVFVLDESFKTVDTNSRIFGGEQGPFDRDKIRATCEKYGLRLFPKHPLGYRDGQLAIGFSYNTPNNSLPIFWAEREAGAASWRPAFRRYSKVY